MTTKHTVACFLLFFFSISFFPVTAQSATGFTGRVVEASSPTTGIAGLQVEQDIALTAAENGSISGVVTSADGNIENVYVYAYDSTGIPIGGGITNNSGAYTISNLLTGDYTVYFGAFYTPYTSEWYDNQLVQNQAAPVHVAAPADTPNINAQLASGGTISGKVTYKETGAAIAGAWVDVCDSTSTVCNSSSPTWRGFAITDANGVYTVQGLPTPGTYKVQFHEKNTSYSGVGITEFYNDKRNISSADSVSVNSTNIDAALQENPNLTQVYEVLLRKKTCHYVAINGKTVSVCQ